MGGIQDTLLCLYFKNNKWNTVQSSEITYAVQTVTKLLNLNKHSTYPDLVGAHLLHAGGAMALKLYEFDDATIIKMGRWISLTFLQYIHTQIVHLAKDISTEMSMPLSSVNIATIDNMDIP
jgi:hypothetical protein